MPEAKRLFRDHAILFDPHYYSDHPAVIGAIDEILSRVIDHLIETDGQERIHRDKLRIHVQAIDLDLFIAFNCSPFIYRGISRTVGDYSKRTTRYRDVQLAARQVISVLDSLDRLGLIGQQIGYWNKLTRDGYRTRIWANEAFAQIFERHEVTLNMIERRTTETILLRNQKKRFVEYHDTPGIVYMRENVIRINQRIRDARAMLGFTPDEIDGFRFKLSENTGGKAINFHNSTLRRIFNNQSFEQGGRFYGGWWQSIPKEYRRFICIDGKYTTEIDFSGLHIRMLYAEVGVPCPDDPYEESAEMHFPRGDQKQAVLTIINAKERRGVVRSLNEKKVKDAKLLCDALMERHKPIAARFFSGTGIHLQFLDSKVAESVMLKMMELGTVALPVHDSFIVQQGREDELEKAMLNAFEEVYPNVVAALKRNDTLEGERLQYKSAGYPRHVMLPDSYEVWFKKSLLRVRNEALEQSML